MRIRRLWLALLAVTLFGGVAWIGVVAWLAWPTTSAAVTAAKEKYARLQLGMSEEEISTILGKRPYLRTKVYGTWMNDRQWYAKDSPWSISGPRPGQRLYNWCQWDFVDSPGSGATGQRVYICALGDHEGVVAL